MQLVSFQIKECFGFRDSDRIELEDPTNLIYILGRNSSGKTSLLTALEYFNPDLIPKQHPNFKNYISSSNQPSFLICEYRVKPEDVSSLKDAFAKAIQRRMDELNPNVSKSTAKASRRNSLDKILAGDYSYEATRKGTSIVISRKYIEDLNIKESLWVWRNESGQYRFSGEPDFRITIQRIQENYQRRIGILKADFDKFSPPLLMPTLNEFQNLLAWLLPTITRFDKAYSLLDTLPDIIKPEYLTQSPNALTSALIEYLGRSHLEKLLLSEEEEPQLQRQIAEEIKEKICTLIDQVNKDHPTNTQRSKDEVEKAESLKFLDIESFHLRSGLDLKVKSSGKPSYYRHLSDNTKMLFAYHLYTAANKSSGNIFLFDEPNNGFHANAQENLYDFLRGLGERGNLVIVSTHSEYLVNPEHLTSVRLMEVDDRGYLRVRNKANRATQGHGDYLALRPILDAIGLRYGVNRLSIRDKVIITEGITDLFYLRAFRRLLGYEEELHIAPVNGVENIQNVVSLLISQGLQFKIILDVGEDNTRDKLNKKFDIPAESIYVVELPKGITAKGSGIEDIFSKKDFATLVERTGNTPRTEFYTMSNNDYMREKKAFIPVPKIVVARDFNENISTYDKDKDFESETLANMRSILEFCINDDWFLL